MWCDVRWFCVRNDLELPFFVRESSEGGFVARTCVSALLLCSEKLQ
jgi:hypothetical protein